MNLNALEEFAKVLAEDIKKYVERGGSLDDLDPKKIYQKEMEE